MASRRTVVKTFYDELQSSATGTYTVNYSDGSTESLTVDSGDVAIENDSEEEELPRIVFGVSTSPVPYNGVGQGPFNVERNNSDEVTREDYWELEQAQFTIQLNFSDTATKEPVYRAIREHFGKYQFGPWYAESLDDDVHDITVLDTESNDNPAVESTMRGDILEVRFEFKRVYSRSPTIMTTVESEYDVDLDTNTSGLTYTTT